MPLGLLVLRGVGLGACRFLGLGVQIVSKCEDKLLALLPSDSALGLTERQILSALSISHGTFFTVCRDLIEAGFVAFVRRERVKYYYRVADGVIDDGGISQDVVEPVASDPARQKKSVASDAVPSVKLDGKKKQKKIVAVYDKICQGIYPDLSAFCQAVEALPGYLDCWANYDSKRYYINLLGDEGPEVWRYDYDDALPYGAVEIWRRTLDRSRQYRRRGREGVMSIIKNGGGGDNAA